jgi:hypothetical protein
MEVLAQALRFPAQIHAPFFPALLPEGGDDARESRRQIAGCIVDAAVGIVVAAKLLPPIRLAWLPEHNSLRFFDSSS